MQAQDLFNLLAKNGFNFFTGVPCSYLTPFIRILTPKEPAFHLPALREDMAVGLAAGAFLAGKLPVIYMQNSGLGYSLEAFASIHLIYYIPALVLVTYRGPEDPGWEEHQVMGEHTEALLQTFKFKYSILNDKVDDGQVKEIKRYLTEAQLPYCLLIPKGGLS
jgi:sulfopyruvate decarboxylase alpha subunit